MLSRGMKVSQNNRKSDLITCSAEARCNTLYKQYGHLASIHGNNKNSLTVSLYTTSVGSEGRFWIGGQRNSANGFEWTDYSDFTYTKWEVGQPSISNGETAETCISVYSTGSWNDDSCEGQGSPDCLDPVQSRDDVIPGDLNEPDQRSETWIRLSSAAAI